MTACLRSLQANCENAVSRVLCVAMLSTCSSNRRNYKPFFCIRVCVGIFLSKLSCKLRVRSGAGSLTLNDVNGYCCLHGLLQYYSSLGSI